MNKLNPITILLSNVIYLYSILLSFDNITFYLDLVVERDNKIKRNIRIQDL